MRSKPVILMFFSKINEVKKLNCFRLKRRQMSAKQISTASEEVPFSTSDESEHNFDPLLSQIEFAKYPQGA